METEVIVTQFKTKPSEKPERRNLMCTELNFGSKDFILSASEAELSP